MINHDICFFNQLLLITNFQCYAISLTGKISQSDEIWKVMMTECFKKLRYFDIKHSRDTFLSLANVTEERNYILNYLKVHMASGEENYYKVTSCSW